MRFIRISAVLVVVLGLVATPLSASTAPTDAGSEALTFGDVEVAAHHEFRGGAEVDFDGRYAYVGQAAVQANLRRESNVRSLAARGGVRIVDLVGEKDPATGEVVGQFDEVAFLDCPGTDNYLRWMDPAVFNPTEPDTQYIVVAFHGNACTFQMLAGDPRAASGYSARNGIMIVDVTDRQSPEIVDVIGHWSAHTVMPHPTRPYIYILPGGTANGTTVGARVSPTAIIDASDPTNLRYVREFEHNAQGCHDLGWTPDGDWAYCAGIGEVQVWDVRGANIENPQLANTIVNPAIQFAHNAVVSPDGKHMLVNDEAFGFHTCQGTSADLYGSLWIYDISIPDLPLLAGRIAPPTHPDSGHRFGTLENTPVQAGWAQSWCAAHNYNFVPGTSIVVASWFAGGWTAHDISNPLLPELVAAYQPADGVVWSAHYYGGYVVTGDMRRGTEILDVPALRAAEEAAAGTAGAGAALGVGSRAPRVDRTDLLVPKVLPPRDERKVGGDPAFCVLPNVPGSQHSL